MTQDELREKYWPDCYWENTAIKTNFYAMVGEEPLEITEIGTGEDGFVFTYMQKGLGIYSVRFRRPWNSFIQVCGEEIGEHYSVFKASMKSQGDARSVLEYAVKSKGIRS